MMTFRTLAALALVATLAACGDCDDACWARIAIAGAALSNAGAYMQNYGQRIYPTQGTHTSCYYAGQTTYNCTSY